jgi:hypothetical protein
LVKISGNQTGPLRAPVRASPEATTSILGMIVLPNTQWRKQRAKQRRWPKHNNTQADLESFPKLPKPSKTFQSFPTQCKRSSQHEAAAQGVHGHQKPTITMIKLSLQIHNNIVPKHNKDCYHLPQPTTLYTLYTISLVHYKVFQKAKCKGRNNIENKIRLGTMRGCCN